jgi:hypothetical protein
MLTAKDVAVDNLRVASATVLASVLKTLLTARVQLLTQRCTRTQMREVHAKSRILRSLHYASSYSFFPLQLYL